MSVARIDGLPSAPPAWAALDLPIETQRILAASPKVIVAQDAAQLAQMACPAEGTGADGYFTVGYDVEGKGWVPEASVCRVRNGIAANYPEPYMRRRDPDCTLIGDELATDKKTFSKRFGYSFDGVRQETFDWLAKQELAIFPFVAGTRDKGLDAVAIVPANAGFFALGLALLQGILSAKNLPLDFKPRAVIYVAPPFRHTHFQGKQIVVHNRRDTVHELFSYNLYPGPSAKKGIYGVLINLGEHQGWVTAHCSTVQVVTPYDNTLTVMHEGASGSGKSEMLEHPHRAPDGRLLLGHNIISGEDRFLTIPRTCDLHPVTDDMALCPPAKPTEERKLVLEDAEDAWFVRVNHIKHYGTDPHLERLTLDPPEPLLFLNIDAVPGSRAIIWEHTMDAPGKPCPNPRVVIPRNIVPNVVRGQVAVDIRSFGVRTPPCTKENPSYGIIGLFHILPPALAWLWRLVAPRGHDNPSVTSSVESAGMGSEGVGSYWPFATGRRVDQANLLLKQFEDTPGTRYMLVPNQHIGAWKVGFMPQWIARDYLARRGGAKFKKEQLEAARCPLLGYAMNSVMVEGQNIGNWFLKSHTQIEVGEEAYDAGAKILFEFFQTQLKKFQDKDLAPLGQQIIDCCLQGGSVEDYTKLIVGKAILA